MGAFNYDVDNGNTGSSHLFNSSNSSKLPGLNSNDNVDIQGSLGNDYINMNVDRSSTYTGNFSISMGAGNDVLDSIEIKNTDSINLGAGDDYINFEDSNNLSSLNVNVDS